MPSRYRRPTMTRARRQAGRKKRLAALIAAVALAVVAVVVIAVARRTPPEDRAADAARQAMAPAETAAPTPDPSVEVTPAPTPSPTPQTVPIADLRAATRPTPTAEGFIPVFSQASTPEKIIAITVDDCYQAENLQHIVDTAIQYGGKLTIFPIGKNVLLPRQAEILKYAWENGFELENHTFTHNGLFNCSDETLAKEIYMQQMALSHILGVEYQCHFLRPRGGDARHDQRLQKYAEQLGYYGIAHWSCSGSTSDDTEIAHGLQPGAIYLFHTTNNDWQKLERFIPWVAEQGYQMVTLNEMFGYPENETAPLTTPANEHPVPTLAPYERVYVRYKANAYGHGCWLLQEKLIELGYLTGAPDGVYGQECANAIMAYQRDHGLEPTGIADPELQAMIFES